MTPTNSPASDDLQTAAFEIDHAAEIQAQVQFEQVRLVWARPLSTSAMAPIVSAFTAYLLWPYAASHLTLIVWLCALTAVYLGRAWAAEYFKRHVPTTVEANQLWDRRLLVTTSLTGLMWAALVLIPMNGDPITSVSLVSFTIGGITAAGIVTVGVHRTAGLLFVLPSLAVLTVSLIFLKHMYGLGIVVMMYAVVAFNSVNYSSATLATNVRLRLLSDKQRARMAISEEALRSQQLVNQLISRAQQRFINDTTHLSDLFPSLLDDLLKHTRSDFGFIGEVLYDVNGNAYIKTHAITGAANAKNNCVEFHDLKNLFGAAVLERHAVLSNDVAHDARAVALKSEFPSLHAFLGAPIKLSDEVIGIIGLANRPGGYDEVLLAKLEPILAMCAQFIDAKRNEAARAAAEEHVARMHAQLSAFIEHTPAAVAMFDKHLTLLAYSQRWRTDFNIRDTAIIGKPLYELLPDVPTLWRESFDRALLGAIEGDEADPYIRSDGSVRWFHWEARPWLEAESNIGGIVLFCEDVTEAKRAADALHSRDQLLSKLSARIPGMLFQLRVQPMTNTRSLLYVSEGARLLYGKSPEELADDPEFIFRVCHPDDRLLLDSAADMALRSGELMQLEFRSVTSEGEVQWFYIEAALERLADASIIWHGYIRDISDRKRQDTAAKHLSDRLRLAARAHQLGIWDCDIASNTLTYDDRLCEIYGAKPSEVNDPWRLWAERVHPDDSERVFEETKELGKATRRGADLFLTEFRLCLPNGTVHRIRSRGTVERDQDGRPLRLVGVNWDMGLESDFANTPIRSLTILSYDTSMVQTDPEHGVAQQ